MRRTLVLAALLFPAPALAGGPLNIAQGTAELGGIGTLNLTSGGGDIDISILLAPTAGCFLVDRVELYGGVSLFVGNGGEAIGLGVGARYVGPMGNNHWYAGGGIGYGQTAILDVFIRDEFSVQGIGGFLFPLNKKVAVDIGARLNVFLQSEVINIPIGYFGVSAFFP